LGDTVVQSGNGSTISDLTISTIETLTRQIRLLLVADKEVQVDNVVFDGKRGTDSIGLVIQGIGSDPSQIRNSLFKNLEFSVQAFNSTATFTDNVFETFADTAVRIISTGTSAKELAQADESIKVPNFGIFATGVGGRNQFILQGKETGEFLFDNQTEDFSVVVRAENNKYMIGDDEITNIPLLEERTKGRVSLGTGTFIGEVLTRDGRPISKATVVCNTFPDTREETDADGTYAIDVFPGTYDLYAFAAGFRRQDKLGETISEVGRPTLVTFRLEQEAIYLPQTTIAGEMRINLQPLRDIRDGRLGNSTTRFGLIRAYYSRNAEEILESALADAVTTRFIQSILYPATIYGMQVLWSTKLLSMGFVTVLLSMWVHSVLHRSSK